MHPGSIDSYLNGALKSAREQLRGPEEVEELPDDPTRWTAEQAHSAVQEYKLAIQGLLDIKDVAGQSILKALWFVALNGLYLFDGVDGVEYNTLTEWAMNEIKYHDLDYVLRLTRVVERIFMDVHANRGKYVTKDGEIITVEMLIERPKLIRKLLRAMFTFSELQKKEQKNDLLQTVIDHSVEAVASKCDELQRKNPLTTRYQFRVRETDPARYDFTICDLSETDLHVVKKMLGGLLVSA